MVKYLVFILLGVTSCKSSQLFTLELNSKVEGQLLYEESFSKDLSNWKIEQKPGGESLIKNGKLEIIDNEGCTIWFIPELKGPLIITYDAIVIDKGGPRDRVSDLNCFWMASYSDETRTFFSESNPRSGKFVDYNDLQLYYVGLGGHNNTKTRFRRYTGDGNKPLLPEHDLSDPELLISPNVKNNVRIVAMENAIQYYRNDRLIYNFYDKQPYTKGRFGFRTVNNHMTIDNFKVYRITQV